MVAKKRGQLPKKGQNVEKSSPIEPHSRQWNKGQNVENSSPFEPHSRQWNESQERLEKSLGESLRNIAQEEAQKYFQQRLAESAAVAAPIPRRQVPEGMSDVAVKVGPLLYKLHPREVKQHFAEVGWKCGDGPLQVTFVNSTRCKTHGWYTFVYFRTAAEVDIALGLDLDDEEENCFTRHEIYGEMTPVTRALASVTCCESAVRT